jgi:hypothetical protein
VSLSQDTSQPRVVADPGMRAANAPGSHLREAFIVAHRWSWAAESHSSSGMVCLMLSPLTLLLRCCEARVAEL